MIEVICNIKPYLYHKVQHFPKKKVQPSELDKNVLIVEHLPLKNLQVFSL